MGVWVINPATGTTREVDEGSAQGYLDAGMRLASKQELRQQKRRDRLEEEYGDSSGLAALAGTLRGATFGLSDVVATGTGLASKETLRALQEYNPISSALGDVTGTVGTLFVGPGTALVKGAGVAGARTAAGVAGAQAVAGGARRAAGGIIRGGGLGAARGELAGLGALARGAQPGTLATLVGVGARESIIGGAIGAGQGVSRVALSDADLTAAEAAEGIIESASTGAKVFGGLGVGMAAVGRAGSKAASYFSRGAKHLEKAQAQAATTKADLDLIKAGGYSSAPEVAAARAEMKAAQVTVRDAEASLAAARAAGQPRALYEAEAALKQAQENALVAAERTASSVRATDPAILQGAEIAHQRAVEAAAEAGSTFSTRVAGRAMGLGLAYAMGGGVGLQALGLIMGPSMARYLGRVAGRMTGPLGATVKDLQKAFKPEIVRLKDWPLERAIAGYAVGGVPGAASQVMLGRVGVKHAAEEAVDAVAVLGAVESAFGRSAQKGGLGLVEWTKRVAAQDPTAPVKRVLSDVSGMTEGEVRAMANTLDPQLLAAHLAAQVNPDMPQAVAQQAVGRVVKVMDYLQQSNPGGRYTEGPIPAEELERFKRKLGVVLTPESFFKALADGGLRESHVEAMAAAYPEALEQVRAIFQAEADKLTAGGKQIKRAMAAELNKLGVQIQRPRMYNPERVAMMQQIYRTQEQPGPKPRPRSVQGAASAAMTPSQQAASR